MKKVFSVFFAMLTLVNLLALPAVAADTAEDTTNEVFLTSERINDKTLVYRDEAGNIVATVESVDDSMNPPVTRATVWNYTCTLASGDYDHDNRSVAVSNGTKIYVSTEFSRTGESYLGFYIGGKTNRYNWLSDSKTDGFSSIITFYNENTICLAIKNESGRTIKYTSSYSLAPFN